MFAKESNSGKGGIIFTLILTIAICLIAYFSCAGGSQFKTEAPDTSTFDGLLSTTLPLPSDGSRPDAHEPNSNAYYAFTSMAQADSFVSHTTGEAVTKVAFANVSQKIQAHRVVNKGEVYKESLSHSQFKGVGARTYVNGNNYIIWNADNVNGIDSVAWETEAQKVTKEDFINLYGSVPNAYTAYIMTDDTILSSEYLGEENGIYSFRYDLNTETATTKIALEMRTMAGTKALPLFEKVSLTVRMDEDWRIREIDTHCVYQVDMFNGVTCTETITEVFSEYNAGVEIPNVDFLRSYMDSEVVAPPTEELTPTDYLLNGFSEYLTGEKPLRVNITATGNESMPIRLDGKAEILINMNDLSALSVRASINSVAYDTISLSDLFIGYEQGKAYIKLGDLKAYGSIEEITTILNKLIPILSADTATAITETGEESAGGFDIASLFANASIIKDENASTATVHIPLNLGDIAIEANLIFNEGETLSLASANVSLGGITVNITPDDTLNVEAIGDGYHNVAPLFNVIQENGDLPLSLNVGNDIQALVNVHLADMSADINFGGLQAKYAQNTVFVKYGDAKLKFALSDIQTVVDKLSPILEGKVSLPDINGLVQSLDVMTLLSQATSNLTLTETNGVLTIATNADKANIALHLLITEAGYEIGSIDVSYDTLQASVAPTAEEIHEIPVDTLNEYNNIVTLLDIIDENNQINLTATVDTLKVDINIDLTTLTVLAKTELYGKPLFVKLENNIVYLSYLDLNVYADITKLDTVLAKLSPIIGEDMPEFKPLDMQEILDSVSIVESENGLTVNASILGLDAAILFDTTDNALHIDTVSVAFGDLQVSAIPSTKADYSDMPESTYYNIVGLLDIIDNEGKINLTLNANDTIIQATLDLTNMYLYAGVEGVEIFANLNTDKEQDANAGMAFVRYPTSAEGYIQGKVAFDDLQGMLDSLKPLLETLIGKSALSSFDLSGFTNLNVTELLSTVKVSEADGALSIGLRIGEINVTLNCLTENNNLTFNNAAINLQDMSVTAVLAKEAFTPYFDMHETYIDAKELVDTFSKPLNDVLTSETLSASLGGNIISGDTVIAISGNVDIAGLKDKPQAKATLNIAINKTATDGTVSTSTHTVTLYYKDLSLLADGETTNVYFIYNEGSNEDTFEGKFTTEKIGDTLTILREIYKNMPELAESLKPILVPDENGYPIMPDTSVNVLEMFNQVAFNNGALTVDMNGKAFFTSLPTNMVASLAVENECLALTIPSLAMDKLSIEGLKVTLGKPADGTITEETFAYTASKNAKDFSSINELLKTLENTSKYRSFAISGKVNMTASLLFIDIPINDKITINAQLEVIDEKTYAVVQLTREHVALAWNDYDGNATIYFDPEEQMIYVKDLSRQKVNVGKWWPVYEYHETIAYAKYTVDEFTADIANILVNIMHFSDSIRDAILNSESTESSATIENTFTGYAYDSANGKFTINLDFEPMLGKIQTVDLEINHDSSMNISSLKATAKMVSVIDLTLNANLTTYDDGAQGLVDVIATERGRNDYNK